MGYRRWSPCCGCQFFPRFFEGYRIHHMARVAGCPRGHGVACAGVLCGGWDATLFRAVPGHCARNSELKDALEIFGNAELGGFGLAVSCCLNWSSTSWLKLSYDLTILSERSATSTPDGWIEPLVKTSSSSHHGHMAEAVHRDSEGCEFQGEDSAWGVGERH